MDKTLDEIIKAKPRTRKPRRNGVRQQILGNGPAANSPVNKARKAEAKAAAVPVAPQASEKIIVSNLPIDVNEAQVKELFSTTVGPTKEVTLNHDAQGRSKGIATVLFQKKGDGTKAYNRYNNRLIDGKRPMKIEVVVDPSRVPQASLVSRVAPAPAAAVGGAPPTEGVQRTGGRPRKGRGGRAKRPTKTVADLDAEMEDYTAGNAPATTAPAVPIANA